jgi:hypothetical protein
MWEGFRSVKIRMYLSSSVVESEPEDAEPLVGAAVVTKFRFRILTSVRAPGQTHGSHTLIFILPREQYLNKLFIGKHNFYFTKIAVFE